MFKNNFRKYLFVVVPLLLSMLAGCNSRIFSYILPEPTMASSTAASRPSPTAPVTTATPSVDSSIITLWVPPQFDPYNGSSAGNQLKNQISIFESENPDYRVDVRVKAVSGPASLMASLQSTAAAAPMAMPGLVALSRTDLEIATLRGLIVPVEGFTSELDGTDWYDYARSLATIQTSIMGLPFAGDSLLVVFRPGRLGTKPAGWEEVLKTGQPVIFPADDPQAILAQALYLSEGGNLQDDQGRPVLEEEALTSVLVFFARGFQLGIFPEWVSEYQTFSQGWQAFLDERGQIAVVWSSQYLASLPPDTTATPLFPLGEKEITPTNGWVWALSDPFPERRAVTMKLAELLVQSDFLAGWTSSAGYLPPALHPLQPGKTNPCSRLPIRSFREQRSSHPTIYRTS